MRGEPLPSVQDPTGEPHRQRHGVEACRLHRGTSTTCGCGARQVKTETLAYASMSTGASSVGNARRRVRGRERTIAPHSAKPMIGITMSV